MMGGAATVRPSSLHIGTAAFAGEPSTKSTDATSVAMRCLTARGLGRVLTEGGGSLLRSFEPADPALDS
jgi:riboflavin biosynthesis pyrimidine reductase